MRLPYVIAGVLVLGWAVAVFGFHFGGIIHVLLVIAVMAVLGSIIQGSKLN
jgi:Family of unknown function (DUF5670)